MENEMWAWSKQFKRLEKQVPCENILFRHAAVTCLIISWQFRKEKKNEQTKKERKKKTNSVFRET